MQMNEVVETIRSAGLHPIRVELVNDHDEDMEFIGTITEYLEAIKALDKKAVFVSSLVLAEDFFIYVNEDDNENSEIGDPIDLCSIVPALRNYKRRIGDVFCIELSAPLSLGGLRYSVEQEWFNSLSELLNEARNSIENDREVEWKKSELEEETRMAMLSESLSSLTRDKEFVKLRTQAAMREYALEKYPQLDALSVTDLKREIQQLAARIEAKGLNRK